LYALDITFTLTYGAQFEGKAEVGARLYAFKDEFNELLLGKSIPPYFFCLPEIQAGVWLEIPLVFNFSATTDMKVEGKFIFKTETNAIVFGLQGSLKGDFIPYFYLRSKT